MRERYLKFNPIFLTQSLLFATIILFVIAEVGFIWAVKNHHLGSLNRYETIGQDDFRLKSTRTIYGYDRLYTDKFLSLIKNSITNSFENFTIEGAVEIRESLLNQGSIKGERINGAPIELYNGLKNGGKLLCAGLAHLYGFLLSSQGFHVRHIGVSRSLFDAWDSHTIVEIWDEKRNKWILTDPTFNVSFKHYEKYLSSDELYDLIHSGDFSSIKAVHGKKTKYEYTLEEYYISYYSLFDNLYYYSHIHLPGLYKYPPFRWFDDRRIVKLVSTGNHPVRGNEINIQNAIIFFMILANPLAIFILFLILFRIMLSKLMSKRNPV